MLTANVTRTWWTRRRTWGLVTWILAINCGITWTNFHGDCKETVAYCCVNFCIRTVFEPKGQHSLSESCKLSLLDGAIDLKNPWIDETIYGLILAGPERIIPVFLRSQVAAISKIHQSPSMPCFMPRLIIWCRCKVSIQNSLIMIFAWIII